MSTPYTHAPMPSPTLLERDAVGAATSPGLRIPKLDGMMPASRPHVCFVAPSTWPIISDSLDIPVVGGAEVQQSIIAPALAARGFRVTMVTLDYGQEDGTVVKGVTVRKIYRSTEGIPVVRFIHPRLTKLWSVLKEVDADIYYQRTSDGLTGLMAAFCKRNGKRSIYSGASDVDFIPGQEEIDRARDRWLYAYGVRSVDRVFVQNAAQMATLREHFGREGVLVPNCFATPADGRRADPKGYVLWVASVKAQKRPELFLELARRLPQYKFVMIGGADPSAKSREYIQSIHAACAALPNVEYRGFMPFAEADRQFAGARVLVNTSMYEGFPNTFLQAWSRGVPSLAFVDTGSRHRGLPAYDIANDVDEAGQRLARLMSDDGHWRAASERVSEHFLEAHSPEAIIKLYERELCALAPGSR